MAKITNLLDELADCREQITQVEAEIRALTPDLQEQLSTLTTQAEGLEKSAKDAAKFFPLTQRHSLKGKFLQLVWKPASVKKEVNQERLAALAAEFGIPQNAIDALFDEVVVRKDSWAITKVGKK